MTVLTITEGENKMTEKKEEKRLPKRLRKYRMDAGHSIYSLADRLNVNHSTISYWENGVRFPRQGKMMELEDFFGVGYRELFEDLTQEEANELEQRRLDALKLPRNTGRDQ